MSNEKKDQGSISGQQSSQGATGADSETASSDSFELTDNFCKKGLGPKDLQKE
jgi:hypothetical protein